MKRDGEHAGEQNILERKTPTMNSDVPITVAEKIAAGLIKPQKRSVYRRHRETKHPDVDTDSWKVPKKTSVIAQWCVMAEVLN